MQVHQTLSRQLLQTGLDGGQMALEMRAGKSQPEKAFFGQGLGLQGFGAVLRPSLHLVAGDAEHSQAGYARKAVGVFQWAAIQRAASRAK